MKLSEKKRESNGYGTVVYPNEFDSRKCVSIWLLFFSSDQFSTSVRVRMVEMAEMVQPIEMAPPVAAGNGSSTILQWRIVQQSPN